MRIDSNAAVRDDATFTYISRAKPVHDALQRLLIQLAGYSLLGMTRGARLVLLDGPVAMAREALVPERERLARLQVPDAARHHHHHMVEAASAIGHCAERLTACLRAPGEGEKLALSRTLQTATDHLRAATRLLPGFEMADLSQACCAAHAAPPRLICQAA